MNKELARFGAILALCFGLAGCGGGGGDPAPSPSGTAAATATPGTDATPDATPATPVANGTPSTAVTPFEAETPSPEEVAYYRLKKKAEDLVLSRAYEEAIPILMEAAETKPQDGEVQFFLMLAHGNLEREPAPDSEAYKYAQKVLEMLPRSNEADKAASYIASAHSEPEVERTTVGSDTLDLFRGQWKIEEGFIYRNQEECYMFTGAAKTLGVDGERRLWQMEVYPEGEPEKVLVPANTPMVIINDTQYPYGKNSWRRPLPRKIGPGTEFDRTVYMVAAVYVEITAEGELAKKRGWIVNQMDRWIATRPGEKEPWGVWVENRLKLPH